MTYKETRKKYPNAIDWVHKTENPKNLNIEYFKRIVDGSFDNAEIVWAKFNKKSMRCLMVLNNN